MITQAAEQVLLLALQWLIKFNAERYKLRPDVVAAIVVQESVNAATDIFQAVVATRPEDDFFKRYIFKKPLTGFVWKKTSLPFEKDERTARATSWGLMQVMGATAREHGYDGQFLAGMLWPHINIAVGCRVLKHYLELENGSYREALRRYNGRKPGDDAYTNIIFERIEKKDFRGLWNG